MLEGWWCELCSYLREAIKSQSFLGREIAASNLLWSQWRGRSLTFITNPASIQQPLVSALPHHTEQQYTERYVPTGLSNKILNHLCWHLSVFFYWSVVNNLNLPISCVLRSEFEGGLCWVSPTWSDGVTFWVRWLCWGLPHSLTRGSRPALLSLLKPQLAQTRMDYPSFFPNSDSLVSGEFTISLGKP